MKAARPAVDLRPTPLSPQVFQILVSLADQPRHGYAMIQDIRERTGGEVVLTASTLYDALARLVDRGWIEEIDGGDNPPAGARRRSYRLTAAGQGAGRQEAQRLERLIETARGSRLLARRRS